jgi:hypothetical protein
LFTGFQTDSSRNRRRWSIAVPAVTVLCLALLALLAFAQVAHLHPTSSDADHCPLCVVMHSAVPAVHTADVIVLVQLESATPVFQARAIARYWQPKLFTRPPPTGC